MNRCSRAVVVVALIGLAFFACGGGLQKELPVEPSLTEGALGPGDVFEVRVFGEEKLSGKYQVAPDGTISFALLGTIPVAGSDPVQVAGKLREGLIERDLLRDPYVSVLVLESNSRRISVLGAVARPGTLPIVPGTTVVQAVSNAGGFTPLASKDGTVVTRRVNGKLQRYRIAVSEVSRGIRDDFTLRAGDIVYVPERVF